MNILQSPVMLSFYYPIVLLYSMIGCWHNPVVCLSICDAVHSGSQG